MAHFYGDLQGNRGRATRMGTKDSGIGGHMRGWDIGACVSVTYNKEKDQDEVTVRITGGSNAPWRGKCLGKFTVEDLKEKQEVRE